MSETIGLDIGSHSIKLVGLKMTSKGPVITHAGIKEIPYGEVKEDLTFASEAIRNLYREVGLKPGKVSLTVSGSGVFIRRIAIPSMPRAELKEAIKWEIKGYLSFPVETAEVDFYILHEFVDDSVKRLDVMVVACPKTIIDRTINIAEGAGLKPVHLDIGPFALWNIMLVSGQLTKKEELIVLVDLGAEKTGIHLFKDGILQFSRDIKPAGADITHAIMDGIISDKEPHILYERAEKIKKEMAILSKTSHEKKVDQSIDLSKISFLIRPVLERLAVEIGRSLDYFRSQFHAEQIDRLLLTGGGSNLTDIASYLSGELRLPVEQFIPFRKILLDSKKIDPQAAQVLEPMSAQFTVATGIALPETKRIELLPAKQPYWTKFRVEKLIPVYSSIIALIIFLWIFLDISGQMSLLKKEHDEKMAKVKALEALQAKQIILKDQENRMKQDLSLFPSSVINNVPFQEILHTVSRVTPDNVMVTLLSVQNKSDTSKEESHTNKGNELLIKGLAFGSDLQCLTALAEIIERLEKYPLFKNAKLVTTVENKLYNHPATEFEIICDITKGGLEGLEKERP
jgi:type IV pilus assembly protein PilM